VIITQKPPTNSINAVRTFYPPDDQRREETETRVMSKVSQMFLASVRIILTLLLLLSIIDMLPSKGRILSSGLRGLECFGCTMGILTPVSFIIQFVFGTTAILFLIFLMLMVIFLFTGKVLFKSLLITFPICGRMVSI